MKCLNCGKSEAIKDTWLGYIPCIKCASKTKVIPKVTDEVTTDEIKRQRKEFDGDIEQPFRGDTLNKRYLKRYGTKGIKATKEDIKNAKDVFSEAHYYKDE